MLFWACCLITATFASTQNQDDFAYPFSSGKDAARFQTWIQETRCVVCQNQNLASSSASIANDLKHKIYRMIQDKKSDAEIQDYLVKRYGEFILLKPRFNPLTAMLWLFPAAGFILLGALLFRLRPRRP